MKLEGSYDVKAPRQKVWGAFLDPETLRKAIPGCEKLELIGNDEYKATLKIGVAAVKGTFEGKVRLLEKKPPESYRGARARRPACAEPRLEAAPRPEMARLQPRRLREQVSHAATHSPFYRRKLKAAGVKPAAVRTLDDLRTLPFTTKDELKENQAAKPPWGDLLAVPLDDVLRVHMTSATTGRPVAFLDTKDDC